MNKLAVIALGGNALLRENQKGIIEEQEQNTVETLENIVFLLDQGYNIVISFGNGPQVGNIMMQNDAGQLLYDLPQMPLDTCVAYSQGGIGFMIERALRNVLKEHGLHRNVLTLMTMVEVDPNDPAFADPGKRIGKTVTKEEADKLAVEKSWLFKEEKKQKGGYRRVVPSPAPKHIINWEVIKRNALAGTIVIALGGGGVPVYTDKEGYIRPVEAVIDKDSATALLASQIHAHELYILTDVPFVYANYGEPNQKVLEFINYPDTLKYLEAGTFGSGTMAPKIKAALYFIKHGGEKSIITESTKLKDKAYGTKITMEYLEQDLHKYDPK